MREFAEYNPITVFIYVILTTGVVMFRMDPIILLMSYIGAVTLTLARIKGGTVRNKLRLMFLFVLLSLINPLFYHNGVTILFVMNDNPITLESLAYGICAAGMIITVLIWFRNFSQIMTGDKLLYIFSLLSPKLSLLLSMTLRYIPLFGEQYRKVSRTQQMMGLYRQDNILQTTRGKIRVLSIMLTWALENGIITAESMEARAYGIGRRSQLKLFTMRRQDVILLVTSLILFCVTVISAGTGYLTFTFYPAMKFNKIGILSYTGYISYGILSLLPLIIELEAKIRWKYLRSKI